MAGPALGVTIQGKGIKETAKELDVFKSSASSAEKAVEKLTATDAKSATERKKSAASTVVASDAIKKQTSITDMLSKAANRNSVASRGVASALNEMSARTGVANSALGKLNGTALTAAKRLGAMAGAALSVGGYIKVADAWSDMQSKVGSAIKSMEAAPELMARMLDLANASYSPLSQTVDVYSRNVTVLREMGRSASEAADYTEALNHALVINATKGENAEVVMNSLSRALSKGAMDADTYDVIMSRSPRILQAVADKMGVATTSLRALATQGKVSGKIISEALLENLEKLREEAAEMPATVADGFTRISTGLQGLIGFFDKATGGSGALAGALVSVGDALASAAVWVKNNGQLVATVFNTVIGTAIAAASAAAVYYAGVMATRVVASITAASAAAAQNAIMMGNVTTASMLAATATGAVSRALVILRTAIISTGIGALVVGAGYLIGKFLELVSATGGFGNALSLLGEVASGVWEGIKTSADAIPLALSGVWNTVKANFLDMAASITGTWANVLRSFGLDAAAEGIATGIHTNLLSGASDAEERAGADKAAAASAISAGWDKVTSAMSKLQIEADKAATSLDGGAGGAGGVNGGVAGAGRAAKNELSELQKKVQDLNKAAAAGRTPIEKYRNSLAELEKLKAAGLSGAAYSMEIERINDEFAQAVPIIGTVSDALGGFFSRGLQGFAEMRDAILGGFKKMLADMISMAIRNKIMIPLMTGGSVAGSAASAAGQAATGGGGGVGSLLSGGGLLGSAWSGASGLFTASLSGLGSAGTYMSAIMGGATSSLAGFAAAAGAIAAPIAAVAAVISFFSTKTKELDRGLRINVSGMTSFVEEFKKVEKSKFWGLSKKVRTSFDAADQEAQDSIGGAVYALQSGIMAAADVLAFGADTFDGFAHTLQISTRKMSESEAQEAIQKAILELGDAFAGMIPGLDAQIKNGEGAAAALDRLAQSMSGVRNVTDLLGHAFNVTGIAGAVVADSLANAFGGLDAMASAADTYFSAFYSEAERLDITTRRATEALSALGVAMPRTRDEYRAMIESLDLTDKATHAVYAALVSMAGVMDQVMPSISGLTAALAALQGNVATGLDASIQAANAAAQANATAASNWYKASNSIREWIAKLRGTAGALTNPEQARAFNEAQYQSTLARAMAGDLTAAQDITGAADRLLASVNATARTQKEAAFAEARVLSDLGLLAGVGDIEGARHDVIRGLLEQQSSIMQQVSDYIGAGNALTEDMIATLETQLSGLDDAIAAAEMINYAYLKERLAVTVDVLADASVPEYLKTLLGNAANGVTGYIDFITRSDLAPDLKWLALTGASEHIKTIEYLAKNDLGPDLTKLAVQTVSELQKSVDFITGRRLDPQIEALALMQLSTATKTVNFANGKTVSADVMALALMGDKSATKTINEVAGRVLTAEQMRVALMGDTAATKTVNLANGKSVSADVMRLALAGDAESIKTVNLAAGKMLSADMMRIALAGNSELSRTVTATLAANIDADAKKLALGAVGAYAVAVQVAFAPGMSDQVKRIVLTQQGDYATTITAAVSSNLTPEARRILLAQQGGYTANITGLLVSNMDTATRTLLLNANTQAVRAVTIAAVFADSMTADQRAALQSSAQTVNRTIRAAIDTAGMSATGALFLAQIGAGSSEFQKTLIGKIALSTLSSDQRLLLSSVSETVQKSVAFKATGSATEDQLRLLGAVSATILRAVGFTATGAMTADQRDMLGAKADTVNRLLALSATGTLTADQQIMLATAAGSVSRSLALTTAGTLTDDQRRVLLTSAGHIARTLGLKTDGGLTEDQRKVLGATAATVNRTLAMTATGWLTADQRTIIAAEPDTVARKLNMTATGWLSADQKAILATTSATITRVIKGWVDMSAMSDQQKSLVSAITGSSQGKVTLGGSFVFDPSTGFKTWYESQTKSAIATPMANLSSAMGVLWTALTDLRKGIADEGKRQADAAAKAAKISEAQAWLSSLAGQRDTAVGNLQTAVERVRDFDNQTGGNLGLNGGAAQLGLTATGRLQYAADAVYNASKSDLDKWRAQFWADGGLEDQMISADAQVAEIYARMQKARDLITSLGGVPSFDGGGSTGNGPRSGGVDGMGGFPAILHPQEVVVDKTQGAFKEVVAELIALRRELAEFKSQSRQIDMASFDQQRKIANRVEKWDIDGLPPERTNA